jgi:hypothetical protein
MENTVLIQLTNLNALKLLYELEELKLIKVITPGLETKKPKMSEKYKGILNKEEGQKLNDHIKEMRSEWNNI